MSDSTKELLPSLEEISPRRVTRRAFMVGVGAALTSLVMPERVFAGGGEKVGVGFPYRTRTGDSFASIAQRFGVPLESVKLAAVSAQGSSKFLKRGMDLWIGAKPKRAEYVWLTATPFLSRTDPREARTSLDFFIEPFYYVANAEGEFELKDPNGDTCSLPGSRVILAHRDSPPGRVLANLARLVRNDQPAIVGFYPNLVQVPKERELFSIGKAETIKTEEQGRVFEKLREGGKWDQAFITCHPPGSELANPPERLVLYASRLFKHRKEVT